jgi:nicotinate-nucleotide adenylyltransferase
MAGTRHGASAALTPTGLLGGSFNPAHRGHRRLSLAAIDQLGLDEVWWLVSPGNPLKPAEGMAPLDARLGAARAMARRSRIRATAIEAQLGTRYTVDTVRALIRRFPDRQFIWIMGADLIGEFHRWRDWRRLAALVPIAVVVRPGYTGIVGASPASAWLRRFVRHLGEPNDWTRWRPPALVLLHVRPDPTSATALRRASPDWFRQFSNRPATRAALKRRLP